MDVAAWLRNLQLERYEPLFRENAIDAEVVRDLTDADLEKLGIVLGHRKKLLTAIRALRPESLLQDARAPPSQARLSEPGRAPAAPTERRQLTVMFVDLVGSTGLSSRLDPEEMREVIRAYQNAVVGEIVRLEGHVAKFMGDGVLAYFGWPKAHEDEAERAVRAGLGILTVLPTLATPAKETLLARVGIATGLVVVGDLVGEGAAQERAVVGETPNLAARLQALAQPGSVVVAESTRQLLGELFEFEECRPQAIKGIGNAVRSFVVTREGQAESRFEALHARGLMPLVGREQELALLLERWEWAKEGEGQVILLDGEPGIGKSRLIRALRERLADEAYIPLSHYCSPYHTNSPLYPVIGLLERAAKFDREDTAERRLDKLEALLSQSARDIGEAAPLLAALLSIPTSSRYPSISITPQRQKQQTLEILVEQVAGLAAQRPVLSVYEDAHWIDASTLELLGLIIERVQRLPLLVLITFRPEFNPPWTGHAHVARLSLSRLTRRHGSAMTLRVTGGKNLPTVVLEQILARTDGVPLFVEELTKAILESGLLHNAGDHFELTGPLPPLAIPATLSDSLMARLDRFAPVKEIAQIGAVIGREFSHELLASVVDLPDEELEHSLDQLLSSELVFRRGTPPSVIYSFKHVLVQDAAYQSLLKSKRQQLHARIARVLEERFPDTAMNRPELLAHHFAEADLRFQAVSYYRQAGETAITRSAYTEAIGHLNAGLELSKALPDDAERAQQELDLRIALGSALMATRGYAGLQVEETYLRARELCRQIGETPQLFPVLHGLYRFYHVRGDLQAAREAGEQLLSLAQSLEDQALFVEAHRALGVPLLWMGDVTSALGHLEQGVKLYEAQQHRSHVSLYGIDPGVVCLSYSALALWYLGYSDQALAKSRNALELARDVNHFPSMSLALVWAAWLKQFCREPKSARAHAEAALALSVDQGFPLWMSMAAILRGWALAQENQQSEGIAQMRQGLADLRDTGAGLWQPCFLALLAEAYGRTGNSGEAFALLEDGRTVASRNGERFYEPELCRLKGELLLVCGQHDDRRGIELCFQEALVMARGQEAKALELRASLSLARLWAQQERSSEARDLLVPILGWFTEGLDTPDLKEARLLLDQMDDRRFANTPRSATSSMGS
jgi:class 3 adenylate cyclase/predicted ATPase